eukprot:146037-Rhodomonas_salina.1
MLPDLSRRCARNECSLLQQALLDCGASVDVRGTNPPTVLHTHATRSSFDCKHSSSARAISETVLERREGDARLQNKMTPVMIAAQRGDLEMLELLAERGANLAAVDKVDAPLFHDTPTLRAVDTACASRSATHAQTCIHTHTG